MERREEERKEVEEIQKRIREKGLPIKLSRPVRASTPLCTYDVDCGPRVLQTTDPYAACYRPVHGGVPAAIDDFAEEDLFGDGGSAAFRLEDEMFGPGQDLGLRRAHTLDGRSRGLNEQLAGLDQL